MPRRVHGEREQYWRQVVERQAGSGLSARRFCRAEGVPLPSFYAWRKKLQRQRSTAPATVAAQRPGQDLFVPLGLLSGGASLEIIHPRGCRIRIVGEVSPAMLRHAIEAIDQRGAS